MPKVSHNPISRETEQQIFSVLIQTFAKLDKPDAMRAVLDDLLSPTEKMMIAKRLMAAILLQRGYSPGAICNVLKMSGTTVNTIRRDLYKHGYGYKLVFENFFAKPRLEKFLASVEKWLDAFRLPIKGSRTDIRRWKRAISRL